jgi:hypothetical protein
MPWCKKYSSMHKMHWFGFPSKHWSQLKEHGTLPVGVSSFDSDEDELDELEESDLVAMALQE